MSKHTPGPWTSSNQGWGDGMADVIGPNREEIARMPIFVFCPSGDGEVIDDPCREAEFLANRRLVEAAPDLLEALIAIEAAYSQATNWEYSGSTDCNPQLTSPVAISARKAIARAKGESQ